MCRNSKGNSVKKAVRNPYVRLVIVLIPCILYYAVCAVLRSAVATRWSFNSGELELPTFSLAWFHKGLVSPFLRVALWAWERLVDVLLDICRPAFHSLLIIRKFLVDPTRIKRSERRRLPFLFL